MFDPRRNAGTALSSLALAALLLVATRPGAALGAECAGGTARRIGVRADGARYVGTFTAPGVSHDGFVRAPRGFALQIVDAEDDAHVLVDVHVPAERFVSTRSSTRYDGKGAFRGRIRLRDATNQRDTVRVEVKVDGPIALGGASPRSLRAVLQGGASCARSCVSRCAAPSSSGALACKRSALYEPFADLGFGALTGEGEKQPGPRSALCGVHVATGGPRCDFLIDDQCLLPYPSSVFLDPDPTTPTGLRIHYDPATLPANSSGKHIEPADWNTLDGFSPGPTIVTLFPDTGFPVDPLASGVAFHTDYARSLEADHPTVLLDASTGERVVHFGEMDLATNDVTKKALILRPGVRLADATRYVVGIRGLVDTLGEPIRPRAVFRVLRDSIPDADVALACGDACAAAIAARRPAMEDVFTRLGSSGVARSDLLLAWDFTTASAKALTGWMVSVRDQAKALGTPEFTITSQNDGGGAGFNQNIYVRIQGTFKAPLFETADAPGARLNLVNGEPAQNGFATVPFVVDIPRIAVDDPSAPRPPEDIHPARATLWGHGLLGDRFQLSRLSELANLFDFVVAAVDMQGMSSSDVGPIAILLGDFSGFHIIPERLHQGVLNHLLLGRLLSDPVNGFASHAAFHRGPGGASVLDTDHVFYSGGSQGGIFGGTVMGVAEDFKRGFLAVPGANYSILLQRSIDFVELPFFPLLDAAYPSKLDQAVGFGLIQQLWDRADPQAYLPHILPGDLSEPPVPHEILVHMATADSQVSNVATEIMVRSLGIPQLRPVHRTFFSIPEVDAPVDGSAFVEVDPKGEVSRCHTPGGTDRGHVCSSDADCPGAGDPASRTVCASGVPPLGNQAPAFDNGNHGSTGTLATGLQLDAFFRDGGQVEQFCSGTCDPD